MLYIFRWNSDKTNSKAHLLDNKGITLCKTENGGHAELKDGIEYKSSSITLPLNLLMEEKHKHPCKTCLHIYRQKQGEKIENKRQKRKKKGRKRKAVVKDDFLSSYKWKKLRYKALQKYGPKCMCCGVTPEHGAVMNVDHIKPRKHFPELALELSNLQILCGSCNRGKSNWDATDWRPSHNDELKIVENAKIALGS